MPYFHATLCSSLCLVWPCSHPRGMGRMYPAPYQAYGSPMAGGPPLDRSGAVLGVRRVCTNHQPRTRLLDFLHRRGGYNLMLGFRLNPHVRAGTRPRPGIHNNVTDAWGGHGDYLSLTQITVDLKVIFPCPTRVQPFHQGGVGGVRSPNFVQLGNRFGAVPAGWRPDFC